MAPAFAPPVRPLLFRTRSPAAARVICGVTPPPPLVLSRRSVLSLAAAAVAGLALPPVRRSAASGLILFPLRESLKNDYYFLRAGESVHLAGERVARTNPVEKTSLQRHSLTRRGIEQMLKAAAVLEEWGLGPGAWIWASQNQSAQEAAGILAASLRVRTEQVVPEFSFLDARGVGVLEGSSLEATEAVLSEIDRRNPEERMPLGEDGTPNESVADVFVRVRQLLAKLETQYSGDEIVVIGPDSDTLSVLEAVLCNIPLTEHRSLNYAPGELRHIHPVVVDRRG